MKWNFAKIKTLKGMVDFLNSKKVGKFELFNTARIMLGIFSKCYSVSYVDDGTGQGNWKFQKCLTIKSMTAFLNEKKLTEYKVLANSRPWFLWSKLYVVFYQD